MSRVSKAGRYTEEIEKINAQKIIDSQKRFTAQWEKATGTANVNLQLERISESDINTILVHGYPASTWSEPQPTPEPTPQPTIRTTKFGESVSTTSTPQPRLTTYYMKSPSGLCRQVSISADGKKKLESTGHIFSKNNICELEPQPTPQPTPPTTTPQPPITIPELPEVTIIPEIPEVSAEQQVNLSDDIIQILNDIESGVILVPDWFRNNIEWVKNGHITQQEFRTAYNYLVDQQIVHAPEENLTITDNMITQTVDHFTIQNGRAVGQITFRATENFNPYYYNKNITNIIQFKDRNGINILSTVKQNTLRFTETELDETIQYDEYMNDNILAIGSSFVWLSTGTPTPFSKKLEFEIKEAEPVKPLSTGFMSAGVVGAIAGLVLLGFIADYKGGK